MHNLGRIRRRKGSGMIFFTIVCIGWIFSVCLHEFAHAAVAYWGGDRTVARKGYLTLNPVKYTHPVYSLAMPMLFLLLGGIGLPGGAVYIEDRLLRSRAWRTAVSLAGPAANAALLVVLALPFLLGVFQPGEQSLRACCVAFLAGLQASALVLNLLPIPPLDGFQAISPWLPVHVSRRMLLHGNVIFVVFLVSLWFLPGVSEGYWRMVQAITGPLKIDFDLIAQGWREFQFWRRGT
jgi:Zn-dependent protease